MLTRRKRPLDETSLRVSRSKRKTETAGSSKDKETLLSKEQPGPVKTNPFRKSNVPISVPNPQNLRTRKQKFKTATIVKEKKLKVSPKNPKEKKKTFCWICHKSCNTQICACSRVYHSECLVKTLKVFHGNICPECQLKSVDGTELARPFSEGLTVYLECVVNWLAEKYEHEIFMSWPQIPGSNKIIPAIDIKTLMKKVQNDAYKKTSDFYSDAKWIHHNTCILYGEKSKEAMESKKLIKDVKAELIDMEACPECYYYLYCKLVNDSKDSDEDSDTTKNLSYEKSFVRLCNPPHDIVWAKVSGYSHWPAKCLKVVNGKAHVRFFGKHEKSDISIDTIFHISKKHPVYENRNLDDTGTRTSLEYTYGRRELLRYKALYEKNIGKFKFFEFREFYNTENKNFRTEKNSEHQKEITQRVNQLEFPSSTNSTSEPCISETSAVADEHPGIILPNHFSNDISVNMTFSVDGCGAKERADNGNTTSANAVSPTNFSECNLFNCSSISTGAVSEIQVKEEFSDLVQTHQDSSETEQQVSPDTEQQVSPDTEQQVSPDTEQQVSSDTDQQVSSDTEQVSSDTEQVSCDTVLSSKNTNQFIQFLRNALNNPSESFDFGRNTHASHFFASVLQKCVSPTSTDETYFPVLPLPNTFLVKKEGDLCPTDNVSSPSQMHKLKKGNTAKVTECASVSVDNNQQNSDCEAVPCSSNKEIAVIDLTSDDDDTDTSTTALANILGENPEMCGLFQHAHETLQALLIRLCVATCKQQTVDSRRRCEAFNNKLNETERRFHQETEKLRDEIKCLQMSLDSEKKKNTNS